MTKLSHQVQGIVFGTALFLFTHNPVDSVAFYVGNMFPDVDTSWNNMSKYGHHWYSHRGITHSVLVPLSILSLSFVLLFVNAQVARILLFLSLGTANHLFFDAMSPTGITKGFFYYPRLRLKTLYRVGTIQEYLLLLMSILLVSSFSILVNLRYLHQLTGIILNTIDKCYP